MNQDPTMQPQPSVAPTQNQAVAPWLWIVLIIVVLGAGIYFAVYFYQKSQNQNTKPANSYNSGFGGTSQNKSKVPSNGTNQTAAISTASWKTFTNSQFKYSVKYPSNYYIIDEDLTDITIYSPEDGNAPGELMAGPMDSGGMNIGSRNNPQNLTLENFAVQNELKDTQDNHLIFNHQAIKVAGQDAIKSIPTAASVNACGGVGCAQMSIYVQKGTQIFIFTFSGDENSLKDSSDRSAIYYAVAQTIQFAQ